MKKECEYKKVMYSTFTGYMEVCDLVKRKIKNDDICKVCIHNKKEDKK